MDDVVRIRCHDSDVFGAVSDRASERVSGVTGAVVLWPVARGMVEVTCPDTAPGRSVVVGAELPEEDCDDVPAAVLAAVERLVVLGGHDRIKAGHTVDFMTLVTAWRRSCGPGRAKLAVHVWPCRTAAVVSCGRRRRVAFDSCAPGPGPDSADLDYLRGIFDAAVNLADASWR